MKMLAPFSGFLLFAGALFAPPVLAVQASLPVLESTGNPGWQWIAYCDRTQVSASGRYLVFTCLGDASGIGSAKSEPPRETVLLDRHTRQLEWISRGRDSAGNATRTGGSGFPSDDGRLVLFNSAAPLHPDLQLPWPEPGYGNAFLRDRQTQYTELIGRGADGLPASPSNSAVVVAASMSRQLALLYSRSNLLNNGPVPAGAREQIYLRNWATGEVELVTVTPGGGFNTAYSYHASLSPDGRYVAFISDPGALGLPGSGMQLLLRDRYAQTTRRLSWAAGGGEFGPAVSYTQDDPGEFSADGRHLAVAANGDGLVAGQSPSWRNIHVIDTQTTRYELITRGHGGQASNGRSASATLSADGRYVAFFSYASNLLPTPQAPGVYVKDRHTGELLNLSATLPPLRQFFTPSVKISADGSTVIFDWQVPNVPPNSNTPLLIYSVTLRGDPPAETRAIPALDARGLLALVLLLGIAGVLARQWRNPAWRT